MRNITPAMILGALIIGGTVFAEDEGPVCHKCEKIREYNAAHPENNYYWYDDYLKDKKESVKPEKQVAQKDDSVPIK